jgi:hypothetical protein
MVWMKPREQLLVLELVEGETLADQIRRGPIPAEASLRLVLFVRRDS